VKNGLALNYRIAVRRMNLKTSARLRAERLAEVSRRVRDESIRSTPNSPRSREIRMPDLGEIRLADLIPPHGTKPGKTRPVLVLQAQALHNIHRPTSFHSRLNW